MNLSEKAGYKIVNSVRITALQQTPTQMVPAWQGERGQGPSEVVRGRAWMKRTAKRERGEQDRDCGCRLHFLGMLHGAGVTLSKGEKMLHFQKRKRAFLRRKRPKHQQLFTPQILPCLGPGSGNLVSARPPWSTGFGSSRMVGRRVRAQRGRTTQLKWHRRLDRRLSIPD